jgi:hypothetical protein
MNPGGCGCRVDARRTSETRSLGALAIIALAIIALATVSAARRRRDSSSRP